MKSTLKFQPFVKLTETQEKNPIMSRYGGTLLPTSSGPAKILPGGKSSPNPPAPPPIVNTTTPQPTQKRDMFPSSGIPQTIPMDIVQQKQLAGYDSWGGRIADTPALFYFFIALGVGWVIINARKNYY